MRCLHPFNIEAVKPCDRLHLIEKMPHQKDLFPPELPETENPHLPAAGLQASPPAPIWYQRISIVILVVFCFYVGVLVFVLPWTRYWPENQYLLSLPGLATVMNSGITRGIVSGLGLLDVWIGITEIIHYHEQRS